MLYPNSNFAEKQSSGFDFRDYVGNLESAGSPNRYICPVCHGNNLTNDPKTTAYKCWNGCENAVVREAVAPRAEKDANDRKLVCPDKSIRPKSNRTWNYTDEQGNEVIRVRRIDDNKGNRRIWQEYKVQGAWTLKVSDDLKNSLKASVTIYRHAEVMSAISEGKSIVWAEGEPCCDALWKMGIPATTSIGGSAGLKKYGNYSQVLKGASLVLCPDQDSTGLKYMEEVEAIYPGSFWLYAFPDSPVWTRISDGKGLDVADWIEQGATAEQVLAAVGQKRSFKVTKDAALGKEKTNLVSLPSRSLSIEQLEAEIEQLLSEDLSESKLKGRILELASRSVKQPKDIRELYDLKQLEQERLDTTEDRAGEVSKLLKMGSYRLKLSSFLAPSLAKPLEAIADYIGVAPAGMLFTLLPTVASLCKVGTRLELIEATDFYALPILYTGLVAESGSAKSPSQKTILKPLFALQADADEDFKYSMSEYEKAKAAYRPGGDDSPPAEPTAHEYYTSDVTREGLALLQSRQPDRGILGYLDELSAVVSQQGQYKGGKGSDREALLSGKDGSPIKVNRASGKRISVAQSAYSITGTTQPSTLKDLMGDMSDGTGQWARFLWCILPLQSSPYPENAARYDISEMLTALYCRVRDLPPETYRMSAEARRLYIGWYNELDRLKMEEPKGALRAVYQKMKGDTGVLALLGHITNSSLAVGQTPEPIVSEQAMKNAITLSKFCISQVKLIHAMGDESSGELSPVMAKAIEYSQRKGWVTPRELQAGIRSLKGKTANDIRQMFQELCNMGYGAIEGSGSQIRWSAQITNKIADVLEVADATADTPCQQMERNDSNGFEQKKEAADTADTISSNESGKTPLDEELDLHGLPDEERKEFLGMWDDADSEEARQGVRNAVEAVRSEVSS